MERLRLYAQSEFSDQKALSAPLLEVESNSRRWVSEAIEAVEMAVRVEAERDVARHEVAIARLETEEVGNARAQVESELACFKKRLAEDGV